MSEPNLDHELERLLSATRDGTQPDPQARARVRAALAAGLTSAGLAKAGLATRRGLRAKLWLLSALAVGVVAGLAHWMHSPKPPALAERASALPVAPSANAASSADAAPTPSPLSEATAPRVAAPPSAARAARPVTSQPRGAAKAQQPADELALVSSMQLALRSGNPSEALALVSEHARRFPDGALSQEREGARAIGRCQLAEPAARSAIQTAFEAHYAGSPYAARVKAACTR